ncbi:hypothetical protein OSTOST_25573, partial [Ostertagia ostertagi]
MTPTNLADEYRKTKRNLMKTPSRITASHEANETSLIKLFLRLVMSCCTVPSLIGSVQIERFGGNGARHTDFGNKNGKSRYLVPLPSPIPQNPSCHSPTSGRTGKMSNAAWTAMLEQMQKYNDADGKAHTMVLGKDVVENIFIDQSTSINEFLATLRSLRSEILKQQQDFQESSQQKLAASINAVQNSIQELAEKIESLSLAQRRATSSPAAEIDEHPRRIDDREQPFQDELPMDMDGIDEGNREEMDVARRILEARIHVLRIRIQSLQKKQPCRPRQYSKGMRRGHTTEARMRCIFCGTRGDHYSDSCGR